MDTSSPMGISSFHQVTGTSPRTTSQTAWAPALAGSSAEPAPIEWSEEEVVFLHWRLLQELGHLGDADTPLEEKFDTLRWIFTETDKDCIPFSFVSCVRVVGCSALSPIEFCGLADAEEIRLHILHRVRPWLRESLQKYPPWVREAVATNPGWVQRQLEANPQWINEQLKRMNREGDLFG